MKTLSLLLLTGSCLAGLVLAAEPPATKTPAAPATDKPAPAVASPPGTNSSVKVPTIRKVAPYLALTRPGGSREPETKLPKLVVLGTTNTTDTISESPVLFFHTTGSKTAPVIFTLSIQPRTATPARANAPVVETRVEQAAAGIYAVDLAASGTKLLPGENYEWSVATAVSGQTTTRDVVATGRIRRVAVKPQLTAEINAAPAAARHQVFERRKLFYDALATLMTALEKQPTEQKLLAELEGILKRIGVERAAQPEPTRTKQ